MNGRDIEVVVVVGAGTMGRGIAGAAALAGYAVALHDVDPEALGKARTAIEATLAKGVELGKVSAEERSGALGRIRFETDPGEATSDADLAIEAVPEDLALKRDVFRELDARCPDVAILASNTSSLPIAVLAESTARPERVLGLHFFNPVHAMELVEVVAPPKLDPAVRRMSVAFVRSLGKRPVVVKDSPGFATSRLGVALGLEAIRMLEEDVASAADIDAAMELGYRHPMGPLKLTDLVGLDVRLAIAEHLARELDERRFAPPALLRRLVDEGRLGKKTGEGFYRWEDGEAVPRELRRGEEA